ncbi:30S ribosomal protein S6 [Rubinisphaera italica]|uniref:Small ribosomal subunit protein bS6 n=1 Tax=Rubinisphaera italica TaxID=2527969 RepID=A0A5C5XC42_9PLAN|nr:30S ribosomal protein S6 [Rubinisphaera italica]TWT60334.1 30S ribosomal protein S6 [Rubinisphaera italica]
MALRSYEIMFLLDSGKFATDPDGVTAEVNTILDKVGAEVVSARPWMDGKLAYPIEGQRKGLHYLTYVKADSGQIQQLQRLCRLSNVVLRHMCIVPPEQLFDLMSTSLSGDPSAEDEGAEGEGEESKGDSSEKASSDEEETANA